MPLVIEGCDAAGACAGGAYTKTIQVDNSHPSVSLQSPGDVPVTDGAQSVYSDRWRQPVRHRRDRLQRGWRSDAAIPRGWRAAGEHKGAGERAWRPRRSVPRRGHGGGAGRKPWLVHEPSDNELKIGEPTASAILFGRVVNGLRCKRVSERVRVPAQWVTVRRHRKLVRVRRRAHTKVVKVVRCHPRTARRRVTVWVTVRRHARRCGSGARSSYGWCSLPEEQLSNVVDDVVKDHQAATLSSVISLSSLSSSVTLMPSLNFTPSSTSPTSSWPLTDASAPGRRQRLQAIASAAFLEPAPLVTLVRSLTVAKLLSIGFVVLRCRQCSAGKS